MRSTIWAVLVLNKNYKNSAKICLAQPNFCSRLYSLEELFFGSWRLWSIDFTSPQCVVSLWIYCTSWPILYRVIQNRTRHAKISFHRAVQVEILTVHKKWSLLFHFELPTACPWLEPMEVLQGDWVLYQLLFIPGAPLALKFSTIECGSQQGYYTVE
jgi:hypothetical protein